MITYRNYNPAYPGERYEPVPGWGMRPEMAGGRRVGVGAYGADPISDAMTQVVLQVWPSVQPKIRAELDGAVAEAQTKMRTDMVIAAGVILVAIGLSAWWVKS